MSSDTPDTRAPSAMLIHGLLVLLCLVWGSTWLVVKVGLRDVPPFTAATMRFALAGLCMAVLAHLFSAREGGGRPPHLVVLAHGGFQFALNFGLVYVGETVIPSGLVAVLWAVFPIFVALGGHFVLKSERLRGEKKWDGGEEIAEWHGWILRWWQTIVYQYVIAMCDQYRQDEDRTVDYCHSGHSGQR